METNSKKGLKEIRIRGRYNQRPKNGVLGLQESTLLIAGTGIDNDNGEERK